MRRPQSAIGARQSDRHVGALDSADSTAIAQRNLVKSGTPTRLPTRGKKLKSWLESFATEEKEFQSVTLLCQMRMKELQQSVGADDNSLHDIPHGPPDAFRLAVACEVMEKCMSVFGRYSELFDVVKEHVYHALYEDYKPPSHADRQDPSHRHWFRWTPYFVSAQQYDESFTSCTQRLARVTGELNALRVEYARRQAEFDTSAAALAQATVDLQLERQKTAELELKLQSIEAKTSEDLGAMRHSCQATMAAMRLQVDEISQRMGTMATRAAFEHMRRQRDFVASKLEARLDSDVALLEQAAVANRTRMSRTSQRNVAILFGGAVPENMPAMRLLLLWLNFHLRAANVPEVAGLGMQLADGHALCMLLTRIVPNSPELTQVRQLMHDRTADSMERVVASLQAVMAVLGHGIAVHAEDVLHGDELANQLLLCALFVSNAALPFDETEDLDDKAQNIKAFRERHKRLHSVDQPPSFEPPLDRAADEILDSELTQQRHVTELDKLFREAFFLHSQLHHADSAAVRLWLSAVDSIMRYQQELIDKKNTKDGEMVDDIDVQPQDQHDSTDVDVREDELSNEVLELGKLVVAVGKPEDVNITLSVFDRFGRLVKNVYKYYSTMFDSRTLAGHLGVGRDGFVTLMKDCRLAAAATRKGGISVKALEHLFVRCVGLYDKIEEPAKSSRVTESRIEKLHDDGQTDDPPNALASRMSIKENKERSSNKRPVTAAPTVATRNDAELKRLHKLAAGGNIALTIHEFCLAVFYLAQAVGKKRNKSTAACLEQLFVENWLPEASREEPESFHDLLATDTVQRMLLKHLRELKKIYKIYADADEAGASGSTINLGEFLMLLNDANVIDEQLNESAVVRLFLNLTDDEDTQADGGIKSWDEIELQFEDFLEGLCGCAIYKFPDPYMPVVLKVHNFITQKIVPLLRK